MEATAVQPSTEQRNALPDAWVRRLFERFLAAYGTDKCMQQWREQRMDDVRAMWAAELGKFSRDEIANGVAMLNVKHPTWPPTLFEFTALCRPSAIDPEAAFHEAVIGTYARRDGKPGNWSHRAIYFASIDVSSFDVLNATWPQIKVRWTKALADRLADPNLPQIPDVPKRLPEPDRNAGPAPEIAALLGGLTNQKRDARQWVRNILERKDAGDKTLTDIAYRMALDSANVR